MSVTDTIKIDGREIQPDRRLTAVALDGLCDKIERLRSRSVATRNANLIGALRAAVGDIGGKMLSPGAMRRTEIELPRGKRILAYPAVGVPTAALLNEIADHAQNEPAAISRRTGYLF